MRVPALVVICFSMVFVASAAQDKERPSPLPRFAEAPCPFTTATKVLGEVRCGYMTVLENRSAPEGRRLKLAVAIVKSPSPTPRRDPVVVLGGGPGVPLVAAVPGVLANAPGDVLRQAFAKTLIQAFRADRDVIFYDQRGVGFSEPKMCPEEATNWAPRPSEGPGERRARLPEVAARCGDAMRRAGLDLAQYNSAVSALDLQDLRRALGYEQWNVFGHSYGSRLALVAMRDAPQGIRSVVISGVYPPNVALWFNLPGWTADVLQRVSAACAAQPPCNAAFPDVEKTFWRTVDELNHEPWRRQLPRRSGRIDPFSVTGASFTARLADTLRTPKALSTVPMLVHAMRARDETLLNALTRQRAETGEENTQIDRGLQHTVQCFEEAPLNTDELRQRMRRTYPAVLFDGGAFSDPSPCERMHAFRAKPEHSAPVVSEIPTLIVTGEFDPQTHRSNGPLVQRSLKNSQLADVRGAGHSGAFDHECTRSMARDFVNAPFEKQDMRCLQAIPPLQFVTDAKAIPR